jgi:hypothetical protein
MSSNGHNIKPPSSAQINKSQTMNPNKGEGEALKEKTNLFVNRVQNTMGYY